MSDLKRSIVTSIFATVLVWPVLASANYNESSNGDALRRLWQLGVTDVEVLRSEFDAGGYDLVMTHGKIVRHIQMKTMMESGKTPC